LMRATRDIGTHTLPATTYTQRSGATPEAETSALAAVYKFVLDCHAKKKATRPGGPDDARKESNGSGKPSVSH
jgi:hypothetical protein